MGHDQMNTWGVVQRRAAEEDEGSDQTLCPPCAWSSEAAILMADSHFYKKPLTVCLLQPSKWPEQHQEGSDINYLLLNEILKNDSLIIRKATGWRVLENKAV